MPAIIFALLQMWATGLIARLLIGGGLTVLVGAAMDVTLTAMLNQVVSNISGMPSVALQLLLLGGVGTAISIIGGALITRAVVNMAGKVMGVKLNGAVS